ncbi:MAG: polysaccharide deacetylase family protein [Verrucomicrobiales bacterium]
MIRFSLMRAASIVLAAGLLFGGIACRRQPLAPSAPAAEAPVVEEEVVVEPADGTAAGDEQAVLDAQAAELKIKKSAQVSVLCYHDFTTGRSNNAMVINIDRFRQHLETLRDARLPVISMEHYLAWRRGEKDIPDPSVMITIDDGWKSTFTLAHPVLREFGFPYTLYLYKNYVDGGGRALTSEEIRQLIADGVTIGSHSVSHPYPADYRRRAKGRPAEYEAWLNAEFSESKSFLESRFGVKVKTYAYPGGYFTPEMARRGTEEWGYDALFTCNPVRTTWDTPIAEIGRFIIFGNDDKDANFKAATRFGGGLEEIGRQLLGDAPPGDDGSEPSPLVVVSPGENATITDRRPLISVDLSNLPGIDPNSVVMRMPGFGEVPATYNEETRKLVYRPVSILRAPEVGVHVRLRRTGQEKEDVISWRFFINQKAHYLPKEQP